MALLAKLNQVSLDLGQGPVVAYDLVNEVPRTLPLSRNM